MVQANSTRSAAWIARYLYHERHDGAGADEDLDRALALDVVADTPEVSTTAPAKAATSGAALLTGRGNTAVRGLMARLLIGRGQPGDREHGRQILEDLVTGGGGSDNDRVALVAFYRSQGDWPKAQEHALALADRKHTQPLHIARYIDLLLRGGHVDEAGPWLDKLSAADPHGFALLNLHVRWPAVRGQSESIEPAIDEYLARRSGEIRTESGKAQLRMAVGRLYAQVGLASQADRTFRQLENQSPASYQPLALWLAGHGQQREAVEICMRAAATDQTAKAATALVQSLIVANAEPALSDRAEPLLLARAQQHSKNPEYLLMLATWRLAQDRHDEAVTLLRHVLTLAPRARWR